MSGKWDDTMEITTGPTREHPGEHRKMRAGGAGGLEQAVVATLTSAPSGG